LLFAITLYALSRLVEVVSEVIAPDLVGSIGDLLEFLAMVSWAAYFIRTCSELTKAETLDVHEPLDRGPVERLEEELREEETQLSEEKTL
ncbi:MAG: hypothetical protein L0H63_11475, partial [Nitrococcus sp.]|nr:hypothetical protein [Nitrococcus sp.]